MGTVYSKDKEKVRLFYENNRKELDRLFANAEKMINIEFDETELSKILDRYSGIDFILTKKKRVFGVACRINFNERHHEHITIRYKRKSGAKTEYQKRIESIKNNKGDIYASITTQIDAENNKAKRAIIFESNKLYLNIENNKEKVEEKYLRTNHYDGNTFLRIPYQDIISLAGNNNFRAKIVSFENYEKVTNGKKRKAEN